MLSSFKAVPEIRTLIEKIKDDRKKRAEAKADASQETQKADETLAAFRSAWSELLSCLKRRLEPDLAYGWRHRGRSSSVADKLSFHNEILKAVGGSQILLDDPSGNPIELFQPAH